jgi:hypothetical protein
MYPLPYRVSLYRHCTMYVGCQLLHVDTLVSCFLMNAACSHFRFSSLFPDTDRFFGSVGSFFQLPLLEGCYEVNPPFDSHSVLLCIHRMVEVCGARTWHHALLAVFVQLMWALVIVGSGAPMPRRTSACWRCWCCWCCWRCCITAVFSEADAHAPSALTSCRLHWFRVY